MKIKVSQRNKIKVMLTIAVVVLLCATGYVMYIYMSSNSATAPGEISYSPPTDIDKAYVDDHKQSISTTTDQPAPSEGQPSESPVNPVLSAWGQPAGPGTELHINGYIPDVVESGGSCEVALTKDNLTIKEHKTALLNAQSTSCGRITIPFTKLSVGTWDALLFYNSEAFRGKSTSIKIEVK